MYINRRCCKNKRKAQKGNVDISDFQIIEKRIDSEIALEAARLVRSGEVDIYAKGSLETKYTLKTILDNRRGLRKSRIVSGITILEAKKYHKLLIFTDAHVRPYPTIIEKMALINNAVEFVHSIGIEIPKSCCCLCLGKSIFENERNRRSFKISQNE